MPPLLRRVLEEQTKVSGANRNVPEEPDESCGGEIGSERNPIEKMSFFCEQHRNGDERTEQGGGEDAEEGGLPAEEGADCSHEFDISESHCIVIRADPPPFPE